MLLFMNYNDIMEDVILLSTIDLWKKKLLIVV